MSRLRSSVEIATRLGFKKPRQVLNLAAAADPPVPKIPMPGRGGANGYDAGIERALSKAQWGKVAPLYFGAASPTPSDQVVPAVPIDAANLKMQPFWAAFENAPDKKKREATERAEVARAVADRAEKDGWVNAYCAVAAERGLPIPTVRRWSEACRAFDRADYPAALLPRNHGAAASRKKAYDERLWNWFYKDFGRQEEPAAAECYRRVRDNLAIPNGLAMPSLVTLTRRWETLPRAVRTFLRKGPRATAMTYPHQTRSVAHLRAMDACNADGHIFDVRVEFPDGEIGRPILAAIQDLYSRMIVAWRLGKTESGDLVRLTYFDAIEKFGVFDKVFLDNGRSWMTKELTAGMTHRYRFRKHNALEDFKGVLTLLGIEPIAVKPFHGQSKPIERSFGDFCTEKIARHPLCAGAYTGNSPVTKPENYGSKAIPFAEFQKLVDQQILLHNRQPNRRTEVCRGVLSFEQAFMESWKQTAPRMLAPSQKFLFLLKTEPVTVRKPVGEIELFGNRFTSAAVAELAGQKVIARFDPQHIQRGIRVYRLDGSFVGEAECIEPIGYDDLDAARDHNRAVRAHVKAARDYSEAEARISDAQFRTLNGVTPQPPTRPRPAVTRIIPEAPRGPAALPTANTESVKRLQRMAAAATDQNNERRRTGAA
ncbi:MAG: transposase domain-containing protein [Candidatus Binatus sp.]|jgi:putative transposase